MQQRLDGRMSDPRRRDDLRLPLAGEPHRGVMSAAGSQRLARAATATVLVLALCAAVLSYTGLTALAERAQIAPAFSWMFPIVVDGLTLVGSLGVVYSVLAAVPAGYPWTLTLIGVSMSVAGNVAGSPPDGVSRAVHAAPPIVLALALEELLRVYRHRARQAPTIRTTVVRHDSDVRPRSDSDEHVGGQNDSPLTASSTPLQQRPDPAAALPQQHSEVRLPAPDATQTGIQVQSPESTGPDSGRAAVVPPEQPARDNRRRRSAGSTSSGEGTKREQALRLLDTNPDWDATQLRRELPMDAKYAREIVKAFRDSAATTAPSPVPAPPSPGALTSLPTEPPNDEPSRSDPAGVDEMPEGIDPFSIPVSRGA